MAENKNNSLPELPKLPDPYASATSMNKYVVGGLVFIVIAIIVAITVYFWKKKK